MAPPPRERHRSPTFRIRIDEIIQQGKGLPSPAFPLLHCTFTSLLQFIPSFIQLINNLLRHFQFQRQLPQSPRVIHHIRIQQHLMLCLQLFFRIRNPLLHSFQFPRLFVAQLLLCSSSCRRRACRRNSRRGPCL